MKDKLTLLMVCGSARPESLNRRVLVAAEKILGDRVQVVWGDIFALPHYDEGLDTEEAPAAVKTWREAVSAADALLIASPEYNYSVPGALKNALDWASRPAYKSALRGLPTAIIGASPSPVGTARMQAHLRQVLQGTVTPVVPEPEWLLGRANQVLPKGAAGLDEETQKRLTAHLDGFLPWALALGRSRRVTEDRSPKAT